MLDDLRFEKEIEGKDEHALLLWTAKQVFLINQRCLPCLADIEEHSKSIRYLKDDIKVNKWFIRALWGVFVVVLLTVGTLFFKHILGA
jgi:hypothetical protein